MNIKIFAGACCIAGLLPFTANADLGEGMTPEAGSRVLLNADGLHDRWNGIGRLQLHEESPGAQCTATLIDTREGKREGDAPAYVLSSAHCVSFDSLNITVDEPSGGHVDFNYFHDTAGKHLRHAVKQISWSSLRGRDLAIIELDTSLQTLIDAGINPLRLADKTPDIGDDVLIVGAPTQYEEKGLRLSACNLVSREALIEHPMVYRHFYKDDCPGLKPGSSGSPLLDRRSNQVLAILATSTAMAQEENRCFENAPCEVREGQPHWAPASNYSHPVDTLAQCFVDGWLVPEAEGCDLPSTVSITLKNYGIRYFKRIKDDASGNPVLPTWKLAFDLNTSFYRHKTVRDPQQCASPHHYSQALIAKDALIDEPVGTEPGLYVLCILGVDSEKQPPSLPLINNPMMIAMEIAQPGPTRTPVLDIGKDDVGGYRVQWQYSHPGLSGYEYKLGADCDDTTGYQRILDTLLIGPDKLPVALCSRAIDMSGQRSAPREDLLE